LLRFWRPQRKGSPASAIIVNKNPHPISRRPWAGLGLSPIRAGGVSARKDHQSVGAIDLLRIGPSHGTPGWTVPAYSVIDGALVLDPPAPGVAVKVDP
jgi:hypothetical protein